MSSYIALAMQLYVDRLVDWEEILRLQTGSAADSACCSSTSGPGSR